MNLLLRKPTLTPWRIWLAFAIALASDGLQILFGAFPFVDEGIDVLAMILIGSVIGFHPLFLPTFLVEFIPIADMLPTWTGCVAIVVSLRRKQERAATSPPPVPRDPEVIDV